MTCEDDAAGDGERTVVRDECYRKAVASYGKDIARFVTGYERDPTRRQELLQDVHLALWRSFAGYKAQCSLRTWVYRIAHNVGASHVHRRVRDPDRTFLPIDDVGPLVDDTEVIAATERRIDLQRILAVVHALAPLDREVMLLYLEGLDATAVAEITGLSARNVATKVHRLKAALARRFARKDRA